MAEIFNFSSFGKKKRKERRRERVIEVSKSAMWKLKKANMILNFDFDLPCKTSPRRCSQGSIGGWS